MMPGAIEADRGYPGGAAGRGVSVRWGWGNNLASAQGKTTSFLTRSLEPRLKLKC